MTGLKPFERRRDVVLMAVIVLATFVVSYVLLHDFLLGLCALVAVALGVLQDHGGLRWPGFSRRW